MSVKLDLEAGLVTLNRGATIYRAGETVRRVFLLRSGLVTLCLSREDKLIELQRISPPQLIGEEALHGATSWSCTAIAANDVELVPIELKIARALLDSGAPMLKLLASALLAKNLALSTETLTLHAEQKDPTPCPDASVTKLFAVLYHAARYTGTAKNGAQTVVWIAFKKYCQRAFLESPVRLEQAVYILAKLGLARIEMVPCETDPDGPEELGSVHFTNLEKIRAFYETHSRPEGQNQATGGDPDYIAILTEIAAWNTHGSVENPATHKEKAA